MLYLVYSVATNSFQDDCKLQHGHREPLCVTKRDVGILSSIRNASANWRSNSECESIQPDCRKVLQEYHCHPFLREVECLPILGEHKSQMFSRTRMIGCNSLLGFRAPCEQSTPIPPVQPQEESPVGPSRYVRGCD